MVEKRPPLSVPYNGYAGDLVATYRMVCSYMRRCVVRNPEPVDRHVVARHIMADCRKVLYVLAEEVVCY